MSGHTSSPHPQNDPTTKRKKAFDSAHIRICILTCAGFFTDGYTLYANIFVYPLLAVAYADTPIYDFRIIMKTAPWLGAVFGHLLFGILADKYGRKKTFGVELVVVVVGTIYSVIVGQGPAISFINAFVFCRFVLGIGIGGDYPISALIISELAPTKHRGKMLIGGYAVYTVGVLSAALVSLLTVITFRSSIDQNPQILDRAWRIILGIGALPAIIALLFRWSIPESPPRYRISDIEREIAIEEIGSKYRKQNISIGHHVLSFYRHFRSGRSGRYLVTISLVLFSASLNPALYSGYPLINTGDTDTYNSLLDYYLNNVLWLLLGFVPAALLAVCLVDRLGRKPLLYIGFSGCAVLYCLTGLLVWFTHIDKPETSSLYYGLALLTRFFLTLGPRSMKFVYPAELFPTRYRSTAFGLSMSLGKFGYIFSYSIMEWISDVRSAEGLRARFLGASFGWTSLMLFGAIATSYLPETNQRPLEEIADEDEFVLDEKN